MHKETRRTSITVAVISTLILMNGGIATAGPLTVPNTFVPSTPATADSVNQNFTEVGAQVTDNDGRITTNTTAVGTNTSNITANTSAIGTNTGNITANTSASTTNATDISANSAAIGTNTTNIGNNAASIGVNNADIIDHETRITALEGGGGGGGGAGQTTVAVDCGSNANALLDVPISGTFPANTRYEITGACNGPILVTTDDVHFVGLDVNSDKIVLPAGVENQGKAAVQVDGAHDVLLDTLTIDATAQGAGSESGGVFSARNAYVRVNSSNIKGGTYGISPYRNGVVQLTGAVNITEFSGNGISVYDGGIVNARGQVTVSTIDNSSEIGIDLGRDGLADFRAGLSVTMPPVDELSGYYPAAMRPSHHSQIRVRNNGVVDINGDIVIETSSSVSMDGGGTVSGNIEVSDGGRLDLNNTNQDTDSIIVSMNSTAVINNSAVGPVEVLGNSVVQFESGTVTVRNDAVDDFAMICELGSRIVAGGLDSYPNLTVNGNVELLENCYMGLFNGTINGQVLVEQNSSLTMEADSGDGTNASIIGDVFISGSSAALIDGNTTSITGNVTVQRSSTANLANNATVSGNFHVRAAATISVENSGTNIIGGTLICDGSSSSFMDIFPQKLNVANAYLVDYGAIVPVTDDFYCGFIYP